MDEEEYHASQWEKEVKNKLHNDERKRKEFLQAVIMEGEKNTQQKSRELLKAN